MLLPLALLLFHAPSFASPFPPAADPADASFVRTNLLDRFQQAFPLDGGPAAAEAPRCLTPLVAELKANWHLFTPEEKRRMTSILTPWKDDLLAPIPESPSYATSTFSCLGQQGAYQLRDEHFSVEWNETSLNDEAAEFLDSLDYAWTVEIDTQGWTPPTGYEDYPILAFVEDEDSYAGAYTSVEYCRSVGYVPYIVAYSGSFHYGTWHEDMAAHEFNHASQFSTAWGPEMWWWEATATYWEENVYPSHNSWDEYITGYTRYPWLGMNSTDDNDYELFYHMYGMAIMGFLLDNHFGGPDLVRDTWLHAGRSSADYGELTLERMLTGMDYEWTDVLYTFMAAATVMDFDEYRSFPDVQIEDTIRELPATGAPSRSSHEPQSLGQNFFRFDGSLGDAGLPLQVSFDGDDGPEWHALLVAVSDHSVLEIVPIATDSSGVGTGSIEFQGDDLYLVVSPQDPDATGNSYNWTRADTWSYTWSASLDDGSDDTGSDDTDDPQDTAPNDTGTPDSEPDGKKIAGGATCGCSAGSAPSSLFAGWALLPALILLGRRRSR